MGDEWNIYGTQKFAHDIFENLGLIVQKKEIFL
jgi:hypothetical protein